MSAHDPQSDSVSEFQRQRLLRGGRQLQPHVFEPLGTQPFPERVHTADLLDGE